MSEIENYKKVKHEKIRFYNLVQALKSSEHTPFQVTFSIIGNVLW